MRRSSTELDNRGSRPHCADFQLTGLRKTFSPPPQINTLKGQEKDVRTVDKLVNSINDTFDDRNMWLVPFLSKNNEYNDSQLGLVNQIFLVFEEPIIISAINIWNYTKTPTRGVREMQIFIDDLLIFQVTSSSGSSRKIRRLRTISNTLIININVFCCASPLPHAGPVSISWESKHNTHCGELQAAARSGFTLCAGPAILRNIANNIHVIVALVLYGYKHRDSSEKLLPSSNS